MILLHINTNLWLSWKKDKMVVFFRTWVATLAILIAKLKLLKNTLYYKLMLKTFYWVKLTTNTAWHAFIECDPWREYENSYIPGYNDDVGFSLTIDECKERCMKETSFNCKSFDYWKARNQCYLSSYTATRLQIQLSRDSRMVHYMLTECPTKPTTVASTTKSGNFLCNTTHLTPQLIKHLAWTTTNINQKWCYFLFTMIKESVLSYPLTTMSGTTPKLCHRDHCALLRFYLTP